MEYYSNNNEKNNEAENSFNESSDSYAYEFSNNTKQNDTKRKPYRSSDAGCVIFVMLFIVFALLATALVVAVISPGAKNNKNSLLPDIISGNFTPTPTFIPGGHATPIPVPSNTQRPMTEFDGTLPAITDTVNPFPEIIEGVKTSVVGVYNYATTTNFFGTMSEDVQGSGTGFVISSDGYVVTNAHVIDGATKVSVLLYDDTELPCDIIGFDTSTDIAVLKFDNTTAKIAPLYLGDSDNALVGEFVITVGDPSGRELAGTITFGIVSAINRVVNIDGRTNTYIQTDAAMNPGNSGGPLINSKGEVIGVNSAKTVTASYDESGNAISAEGLGFAIPINTVKDIVEKLITKGKIERPGIGVTISPATDEELYAAHLSYGLVVRSIVENGPAHKAGLVENDIILMCNGTQLNDNTDLTKLVSECKVGDTLNLTVYHNGKTSTVKLVVGDLNNIG